MLPGWNAILIPLLTGLVILQILILLKMYGVFSSKSLEIGILMGAGA